MKMMMDWGKQMAKIQGQMKILSITPKKFESLKLYDAGRYWIEVNVKNSSNTFDVFEFYDIKEDLSVFSSVFVLAISSKYLESETRWYLALK